MKKFLVMALLAGLALGCSNRQKMPDVSQLPDRPEMPDPLLRNDGARVTSPNQWPARREEMKQIIEYYFTGRLPPPPGNVIGQDLDPANHTRHVRLSFGPNHSLAFDVTIFTPTTGPGPFPTIIHLNFIATPKPQDYAQALNRGYAVVTYNYKQCGADNKDCRTTGFFPAYPDYDWADLAAWAWSMSRVVDYLESQPFADKHKLIAMGHSRLGKATLIAGAFDDRFALVAPAGSGCAGTGAFRFNGPGRGGKEGIEQYVKLFSYQLSPRMPQFVGHVTKLPFDQHWLIALCAPRPFIAAEALNDQYCNANAATQSVKAAQPVYDLLGASDKLAIHFRPGKHELSQEDWKTILDFADVQLR